MSKKLNCSGAVVGNREYFKRVNNHVKLDDITSDYERYDYYDLVKSLSEKSVTAIGAVYSTISDQPMLLNFIPQDDRKAAIKLVECLEELAKFGNRSSKANDCKTLLELRTRPHE